MNTYYKNELVKLIVCAVIGAIIGLIMGVGSGMGGIGLLLFTGAPYAWLVLPKVYVLTDSLILLICLLAIKLLVIIFAGFIITPIAFIKTIVTINRSNQMQ